MYRIIGQADIHQIVGILHADPVVVTNRTTQCVTAQMDFVKVSEELTRLGSWEAMRPINSLMRNSGILDH